MTEGAWKEAESGGFVAEGRRKSILGWRAADTRAHGHEKAALLGEKEKFGGTGVFSTRIEPQETRLAEQEVKL